MTCVVKVGNWYICTTKWNQLTEGLVLEVKWVIIQHLPFWEYDIQRFNSTNEWGCIWQCIMITRSVDSLGQKFLDFLDQASSCHVGRGRSSWLHRCGMGCHRHRCFGILLNSWHGWNSWGLACLGCWCCRCSRCGLHMLCRLWQCRLYHWEAVSDWSLQCGSCATWGSVDCFDTVFTKVSPHAVVCGTIAGVYLIAVLW